MVYVRHPRSLSGMEVAGGGMPELTGFDDATGWNPTPGESGRVSI